MIRPGRKPGRRSERKRTREQEAQSSHAEREAAWADELRTGVVDRDRIRRKARTEAQSKQFSLAGCLYGALALAADTDPDLALNAAKNYELGGATEDALRWYLNASECFARQNYPTKAIATLRMYRRMAPDEQHGPLRIFHLCQDMDGFRDRLLEFLSPRDQAGHHLRSQEIFSTFDDATFEEMLDAVQIQQLEPGDVLVQKDDEASSLFIVINGRLDGFLEIDGVRTQIGSIHPGEICGEIGYFLGGRRTAEVVAGKASSALELPYSKLDELRIKVPEFGERLDELYHARMLANQLAATDFFSGLDASLRNEIARRMRPVSLSAGQTLFAEKEESTDLYVIQSGEFSVTIVLGEGRLMKPVSAGVVGEFALALGGKRTASLVALSDCKLMCLSGEDYRELYEANPPLQDVVAARKRTRMEETREFIMGMDEDISDRICTAMLRTIWGPA